MNDFLAMGGYPEFVWPSYGIALLVLLALTMDSIWRRKRAENDLASLEAERPSRRRQDKSREISET